MRMALGLIDRLIFEPWSVWRAKQLGGPEHWQEHMGWSPDTYQTTTLADMVNFNTAVSAVAGSGKAPPEMDPLKRPTFHEESAPAVASLADFGPTLIKAFGANM